MTIYTPEVQKKLETYLATHELPVGVGTEESACSIAAINLALTGKLTDDIPDCMSAVLGRAIITLQDDMPHEMRNSRRYKEWLPHAAGTGRGHEKERLDILMDWMWGTVLPQLQPLADTSGFGEEWKDMCSERTSVAAARAAAYAAYAAYAAADAARAAHAAARTASSAYDVDPIGVLERMTYLIGEKE